ncbi:MAG: patatin [Frankiales bacterium]|nr:patatin [Frankiales bacterium]
MSQALVLAGGGVTGIAWELGVLLGLRDVGVDLTDADLIIGTSAGAAVGAQVRSGTDLAELFARQLAPDHHEIDPAMDLDALIALFTEVGDVTRGLDEAARRKVGAFAKHARTVSLAERRAVIAWRLPSHQWPERELRVTSVDADTGELVVLDRTSGVDLVDAVAASCCVPGVWPPVPLLGRTLIDGGTRSLTNLDLAADHDEVIAIVPMALEPLRRAVVREADALRHSGTAVQLLFADEASAEQMGPNALDPALRGPSALTGRRQGRQAGASF